MIAWIMTSCNLGRSFRDFCSLVYSGGLSRDLDVNSVEIKDSSASCHQEMKNRRTRRTGDPKIAHGVDDTMGWAATSLACRASFLHVEPFRLKLGFFCSPIVLGWATFILFYFIWALTIASYLFYVCDT
ncbi:hypothetical protein GQ457_10G009100 [Hibiscus cannabinus]